jgi:catechol 2,3-dioxygenase-like lactoylglutathione lyase family enzyme
MAAKPVFTGINHVGIVTGDLERAVRTWADRYGVGPWRIYTKDPSNMRTQCDGEPVPFAFRVALAQLSPTARIELIQPLDERSPYADSLARHAGRDHVHHIRMDVADYAKSRDMLGGELGLTAFMDAEFDAAPGNAAKLECKYFETTADLGFVTEIVGVDTGFTMPEPETMYPARTAPALRPPHGEDLMPVAPSAGSDR